MAWISNYIHAQQWDAITHPCTNFSSVEVRAWLSYYIQGWGLLSQFPPFRYFPIFSALSNHTLAIEYHVYIWQVSPQLSCGDTCQIWMWFEESNMCFCQVENFAYGEINERSFSNPHPRSNQGMWLLIHALISVDLCSQNGQKQWNCWSLI